MNALRPRWKLLLILGVVAIGSLGLWRLTPKPTAEAPLRYDVPRTVSYSFTLTNTTPRPQERAEFWVYAPVKQTATQKVVALEAYLPYELSVDALGNQVLRFILPDLPPFGSRLIRIKARLLMAPTPNSSPVAAVERFLKAEHGVESDYPPLQTLAKTLVTDHPLDTAQRLYQWVTEHVRYSGYRREARGARYALEQQQGDCTEYADLFTALARASGLPARRLGGYVSREDAVLKAEDYHDWAEVYIDGVWRLVDPQKQVFRDHAATYIAMQIITDAAAPPLGKARRFHAGAGLRVRMN